LRGDGVELARQRILRQRRQHVARHQPRRLQPAQQIVAIDQPVDGLIDRRRDGIQEVDADGVGEKHRGWACVGRHGSKIVITTKTALDKLRHARNLYSCRERVTEIAAR
jgi:hypothetical protein